MKRLALMPLVLLALLPAPAACSGSAAQDEATGAADFLTISEARREIRHRLRGDAREDGYSTHMQVNNCDRISRLRVICAYYQEAVDLERGNYYCEGDTRVTQVPRGYFTKGIRSRCAGF
jgi:hypothetical protein